MNKTLGYRITIGLLIALLVALNVIVPYIKQKRQDNAIVSLQNYYNSVKGNDQRGTRLTQYLMEHPGKSVSLSASANKLAPCALLAQALNNLYAWGAQSAANIIPAGLLYSLWDAQDANGCSSASSNAS